MFHEEQEKIMTEYEKAAEWFRNEIVEIPMRKSQLEAYKMAIKALMEAARKEKHV